MKQYSVTFQPAQITVTVPEGQSILQAQIRAGLHPDAPCGGKGTCGKCRVTLDGTEVLACQTQVDRDMTVFTAEEKQVTILTGGISAEVTADGVDDYALAFDIGTTTVVAYLLDGHSGKVLAQGSCMNPQSQYGADVISRIQLAMKDGAQVLSGCIRQAMEDLTAQVCAQAGICPDQVTAAAIVGNTAMHHLLLGVDTQPLVTPPYMPGVFEALELGGKCKARILPNIAGFVGGDTVGCMVATRFSQRNELTLMIDIGTNGEMVLGNGERRIACSTAAGPAFEGAKISRGMRGCPGAIDHVWLENGEICHHVIGDVKAVGICGSGLLDLVACMLDAEILDESGYLEGKQYIIPGTDIALTQADVREVQLAKAAIRAGIELMCEHLGVESSDIRQVLLAGAFGNYMDPRSACRIGMIPPSLQEKILPIGNAAGEGAKLCAVSRAEFEYSKTLAAETEFLELASKPEFQDWFVDALEFAEEDEDDD